MGLSSFQRRRRELAAKENQSKEADVEQNIEQSNNDVVVENDVEPIAVKSIDEMTKNEIMAELDKRNVEYNSRDNKETLKGLLVNEN